MAKRIRLVLADDHPIVLHGLRQFLERHPDIDVVATAQDGMQALAAVREHRADVLLLDVRMPGLSGLEVLRTVSRELSSCRVVLLTASLPPAEAAEALAAGAMGIVLKESSPDDVLESIRRAAQGLQWFDKEALAGGIGQALRSQAAAATAANALTAREVDVIKRVAEGLRNKEIAERLAISEGTVKIHLHNIYEKLGVDGRLELVLYAQAKGLV